MAAPEVSGGLAWIILGEIINREVYRPPCFDITVVFLLKRITVIFEMVKDIDGAMCLILHKAGSHFLTSQKRHQPLCPVNFSLTNFCPAADRNDTAVRKATQILRGWMQNLVPETPECFVRQHVFFNIMKIFQHRHAAPADAKGGMDIGLGPIQNSLQLFPIIHIFVRQMFNRSTGHNKAIKFFTTVLHCFEGAIKILHM